MEDMTIQQASAKWDISERRIQVLCASGRIRGAHKFGNGLFRRMRLNQMMHGLKAADI